MSNFHHDFHFESLHICELYHWASTYRYIFYRSHPKFMLEYFEIHLGIDLGPQ